MRFYNILTANKGEVVGRLMLESDDTGYATLEDYPGRVFVLELREQKRVTDGPDTVDSGWLLKGENDAKE